MVPIPRIPGAAASPRGRAAPPRWAPLLLAGLAWAGPVAAADRSFGRYTGEPSALVDAARAHLLKLYPDLKVALPDARAQAWGALDRVGYSAAFQVPRTLEVGSWGGPVEKKVLDLGILAVGATVFRPRAPAPGEPAPTPGEVEERLHVAPFEDLESLYRDELQHGYTVLEQRLPGPSEKPGSYHDYRIERRLEVMAGNVRLSVRFDENDANFRYVARPDPRAVAEAMLALLPGGAPAAGKVEVFPFAGPSPSTKGLIPASERLPALIACSGVAAGEEVRFSIAGNVPGELRAPGVAAGRSVSVRAGREGRAEARYHYLPSGTPLAKALTVPLQVGCGATPVAVEVKVGLGLAFDRLRAVQGQTHENDTHAFTLTVKSGFHPDLDLWTWLFNAEQSNVWPDARVGMFLALSWVNFPVGAESDFAFNGPVTLVAGEDRQVLLTAVEDRPWYGAPGGKDYYPAVVLRSGGAHAYRVTGRGAALGRHGTFLDYAQERTTRGDALVILSKDEPEAWYQSLACSLNATNETQYLMLEAAKLVPVYGAIADKATTVSGLVCGLLKEEYEKSLMDLANWLGAQYLDNLMEPAVFDKLTLRQQDAVLAAKAITTGGTDNYKRKQDVDGFRSAP